MIIDSPNRSGTILAGDALRFAGHVRNNVGGDTVRYHWDFGDGRSSDIQNPGLVSFANPGKKVISLSVSAGLISTNWPTAKRIIEVIPNTNTVPDLAVIRLDVPSDLSINQAAQIEYAIQNLGDQSLSGPTWKDVLYLSRDPYWDSSDKLLASLYVTRSLPVGASYTNQLTIQLPPVEEGAYYLILSTDDAWAILEKHQLNNEFAVAIDLVVPRLTNGLPLINRFTDNGDQRYFRIDIPAGQNLRLVLNDTDNQGVNELYVSFGAFLTLQSTRLVEGFWTSAEPEGFSHSIQFLASGETPGVLQPGESVRVPVYYAGWQQPWDMSYSMIHWSVNPITADNPVPMNWPALKDLMRPASYTAEAWDFLWPTFTAGVGNTWGDFVRMLDENATYLGRLKQRVVDVGQLLAFEMLQAEGQNPFGILASAVDAQVTAPGMSLVFSRSFPDSISGRLDLGPLGRGWTHNWEYTLTKSADGKVTIHGPAGSRRIFQTDSRRAGVYFSEIDDKGVLTGQVNGTFSLPESGDSVRVFRASHRCQGRL